MNLSTLNHIFEIFTNQILHSITKIKKNMQFQPNL
jgi:hypothetical protein